MLLSLINNFVVIRLVLNANLVFVYFFVDVVLLVVIVKLLIEQQATPLDVSEVVVGVFVVVVDNCCYHSHLTFLCAVILSRFH